MKNLFLGILLIAATNIHAQSLGIFSKINEKQNIDLYSPEKQNYKLQSGKDLLNGYRFNLAGRNIEGDFIIRARCTQLTETKGDYAGLMLTISIDSHPFILQLITINDGKTEYRLISGSERPVMKQVNTGADVFEIERRGNTFYLRTAKMGEVYKTDSVAIEPGNRIFAGLTVGSNLKGEVATAIFDNVRIVIPAQDFNEGKQRYLGSLLEILNPNTGSSDVVFQSPNSLQAPNWMQGGDTIIFNSRGLLYKLSLKTKAIHVLNTGRVKNNNNDHVISFDGKMIGLSGSEKTGSPSLVYTVPIEGGEPFQITQKGPSYLHGWSPDGKYVVYVGQRDGEFDIYRISSEGGNEIRLTDTKGLDDGPEYSPDGKFIYFNSVRNGGMHIFRMKPDGSDVQQLTDDSLHDWFPHVSPDGKTVVFLSFNRDVDASDHPFYKNVYLRLMPANGGEPRVVAYLYGGQGTINTPSWSPDSKRIAFISNTGWLSEIYSTENSDEAGE